MKPLGVVALLALTISGCGSSAAEDHAAIQGTWSIVYEFENGRRREPQDSSLEFAGDKCRFRYGAGEPPRPDLDFKLDGTKSPKWFEMKEQDEKVPFYGIYELQGDDLKICVNERSKSPADRVATFQAEPPAPQFLIVLKRKK